MGSAESALPSFETGDLQSVLEVGHMLALILAVATSDMQTPPIHDLVDKVDPKRLRATVVKLASFPTRNTLTTGCAEAACLRLRRSFSPRLREARSLWTRCSGCVPASAIGATSNPPARRRDGREGLFQSVPHARGVAHGRPAFEGRSCREGESESSGVVREEVSSS